MTWRRTAPATASPIRHLSRLDGRDGACAPRRPTLLEILNIVEGWDLAALGHNSPEYIYRVAMAMKAAFADRSRYLGDPAFGDVPVAWLVSKERAAWWRGRIDAGEEIGAEPLPDRAFARYDARLRRRGDGTCVALTHSLGGSSGVISPGSRVHVQQLDDQLQSPAGAPEFDRAGQGSDHGDDADDRLRGTGGRCWSSAPRARRRIITAIAQVILNHLEFGMPIQDAVLAPRFDAQSGPIVCQIRVPGSVVAAVAKRHPVERRRSAMAASRSSMPSRSTRQPVR